MKKVKRRISAFLSVVLALSCVLSAMPIAHALPANSPQQTAAGSPDDITLYPQTPNAVKATDYTMTINGKEVFIEDFYKAAQVRLMHNGTGPLDVVVTVKNGNADLANCEVYPRRAEVYPTVDKDRKTISFTILPEMLTTSMQYIITIPGVENIILMVDPPETDKPDPEAENVLNVMDVEGVKNDGTKCTEAIQKAIDQVGEDPTLDILYFPDGLYVTGRLEIKHDNVAIYLSSGTLIKGACDATTPEELAEDYPFGETGFGHNDRRNGSVFIQPMGKRTMIGTGEDAHYEVEPIKNFKLYGRGVIDGSGREIYTKVGSGNDNQANWIHLFEAKDVDGLVVKDVIFRNSSNWCFKLENVNDAEITNVKAINSTDQRYADGMDLSSVTNATYTNSMSYSQDDAIAIMTLQLKNPTNTGYDGPPQGPTENITFKNHLGYTDCSAVRIGWDSTDHMNNLTFDGCEWAKYNAGGINIHRLQYDNKYSNITFKNCRWDNASCVNPNFSNTYGTDGNGFSRGEINASLIKLENCIIDGHYSGSFEMKGKTIDQFVFDSTRMSNGTQGGLVTSQNEIPRLNSTGTTYVFTDTHGVAGLNPQNRYQAETAFFGGGSTISTAKGGYDGFGFVRQLNTVNANIRFTLNAEQAGNYDLTMHYAAPAGVGNMKLYVNGQEVKGLYFPGTDGQWADHVETVALKEGENTIELKAASTAADSISLDYLDITENDPDAPLPPQDVILNDTLEAEAAPVITGGQIVSNGKASQTKAVKFEEAGASIVYGALQDNASRLVIRYQAAQDTVVGLYNGEEKITDVFLPATGTEWKEISVTQAFAKGLELKLQKDGEVGAFAVDYIKFETGYPALLNLAKYTKVTTNASIQSDHYRWYGVRNAVDNNQTHEFITGTSGTSENPTELLIDLELIADIYEINIYNANGATLEVYTGNDPDNLTKVADATKYSSGKQTVVFNEGQDIPLNTRYVKLSCVGGKLRMSEIEIMGVKTDDAAGPDTNAAKFKPILRLEPSTGYTGIDGYNVLNDWTDGANLANARYSAYVSASRPMVIEYDLLQDYKLDAITNYIDQYSSSYTAEIQVEIRQEGSDEWVTVYSRKDADFTKPDNTHNASSWPIRIDFDKSGIGRYVRFTCYGTSDSNQFESCELEVNGSLVKTTGVNIEQDNLELEPTYTGQLTAVITPEDATNQKLAWSSSDNHVATVDDNGLVTAHNDGTATITVRTLDGSFQDTCTVVVSSTTERKAITSIAQPENITAAYGTAVKDLSLPRTVTVTLEDGTQKELAVTWDTSAYNPKIPQTYTFAGTLTLVPGVSNPDNLKASIQVTLEEKGEKAITDVTAIGDITVKPNTPFQDLNLPKTVEVTVEGGEKIFLNVTWDESGYTGTADGDVNTLEGTISLTEQELYKVTNPEDLKATVKVIVYDPLMGSENLALDAKWELQNGTIQWNNSGNDVAKAHDDDLDTEMIIGYAPDNPNWQATPDNPHRLLIELEEDSEIVDIITYRSDKNDYTMDISVGMTPDTLEKISTQQTYEGSNGDNTPVSVILDSGKSYPAKARYVLVEITHTGDNSTKFSEFQIIGKKITEPEEYQVTVENGEGSGTYAQGDTVTIRATVPEGKVFDKWVSQDGVVFVDATAPETTFTMPGKAVTVTATFKDPEPVKYPVTVENGEGSGTYAEGDTVTIQATVPEGKVFDKWVSEDGVVFADANASQTTFTMPGKAVTVTATFKDPEPVKYPVTVENGEGSGTYAEGDTVTIQATVPEGKVFDKWVSEDGVVFADANASQTTFTMPGKAVTVTATFKDPEPVKYSVTVENGEGSGSYVEGDTVTIKATVPEGKVFDKWVSEDGVVFADANASETTFTMPGKAVTVTATFKDPEPVKYPVTVENGEGSGSYAQGATVTIKATVPEGKIFDKWVSEDGVVFADANASETTFTMPGKAVTVTATFKDPEPVKYPVTVENGEGSGTYAEGDTVTIRATVPEGKVFDKWVSEDGVVFADANASETTFTMPGKTVTVTATFRDAEPEVNKDALQKLYDQYKNLEQGSYTDSSWEAFQKALENAGTVLASEKAEQQQVDEALKALQAAVDGLKKAPVEIPQTGDHTLPMVLSAITLSALSCLAVISLLYCKKKESNK